jgi:DNA modification methylase
MEWKNNLYYGDNLDVLRRHVSDESVNLIYLDPPFNSNVDYAAFFSEQNGTRAAAQIKAFEDTWRWDRAAEASFREAVEADGSVSRALRAFRTFLGESDMLAYLAMMAPRLVELRRVMKPTASIYLHCDPTASHYLKTLMDAVFGAQNFCNEIIWWYRRWTAPSKRLQRLHDVILWYAKEYGRHTYNTIWVAPANVEKGRTEGYVEDESGRFVRQQSLRGKRYEIERDPRGVHAGDVWPISFIHPSAKERLGYPTQKPEELLERIVDAGSNEGDLVLDPFCGCGTSIAVAERLKRRWIGIDITHLAIGLIKHRLLDTFGDGVKEKYRTIGEPVALPDAETLAKEDPYQFQWCALGLVGARPTEGKKGADKGIDGRLFFHDEAKGGKTKQVIFSVKAGHTNPAHVRDLRGVLGREQAENAVIGVLITMQEPTPQMRAEAATGEFYDSPWGTRHPKLQILTVAELLEGKGVDMPPLRQVNRTFKKAPRARGRKVENESLPLDE